MIYLIGGAPRVGKSLIAAALVKQMNARVVSTDDLRSKVFHETSDTERLVKFPLPGFSGMASENTLTPEERTQLQIVEAQSLALQTERIVAEAIHDPRFLVIEGVHLLPDHFQKLRERFGGEHIRAIFIGSQDIERVLDGIKKNTNPDDWMKEADAAVQRQVAEFVVAYSGWIKTEATKTILKYVERTEDFTKDVHEMIELITKMETPRI